MAANVSGSAALTPTSMLVISRVSANAPAKPTIIPAVLNRTPSVTIRRRMLPRGAPNTIRIPISDVR